MTRRPGRAIPLAEDERQEHMDKDRIEGAAKQAKGAIKEAAGKVTGSTSTELEGKADKVEGKTQAAVGKAKDTARDAVKS
ncbi:CsbD family protein [Roseomonas sp. USHLN139]|uniref:CsbD family protein n=1 Tax=Roseomonas sp. USHLN139 TaxID=3081298 RepID=UPI003B02DBEB